MAKTNGFSWSSSTHFCRDGGITKFQSSTFDTLERRKFIVFWNYQVEYKNCKLKLIVWAILRTFRKLNEFEVEIPTLPIDNDYSVNILFWRDVEAFLRIAVPQRRAGKYLGHTWKIGKRFCWSTCIFISFLSSRIELSLEENYWRTNTHVYSGEKWKARIKLRSEMPVRTVSQRFSHLQWRRFFKGTWGKPTTTADFGSPFWQVPPPATFACWKKRFKTEGMYFFAISCCLPTPATFGCWMIRFKTEVCTCSQFPTEAMQWIKEVELVDSVDELRSSSSTRGVSTPNFEVLDARIASALNKIIHNSHFRRRISLEEQKTQKFPSPWTDCLLDLRLHPGHWEPWFSRKLHRRVHYQSTKWRYSGIRFKVGRNFVVHDENPS